jgi:CheY-like chemotaxis protein
MMRAKDPETRKRILFFDDEEGTVEEVVAFLERNGFSTTGATTADGALFLFSNEAFNLVVVDLSMPVPPGFDVKAVQYGRTMGLEVARRMHALKPTVPIVALTVVDKQLLGGSLQEAGIRAYIEKPAEPNFLLNEIRRYVVC